MLYYPFVQPPRDVLAQGILYWDRIGTIVPERYVLPPQLERVRAHGIYEPLEADRYVQEVSFDRLVGQVENLLSELPARALRIPRDPVTAATRLYYGKLPVDLEYRLREAGVLRELEGSYQAPEALLGPLLSLLARAVADGEPDPTVGWVCHTNIERAAAMAYDGTETSGVPGWRVNMGWIFKVPSPETPLEDILDFRRRYNDERIELLRAVDKFVAEAGGPDAPDLLPQIAEEVEYAMAQIDHASRARGIKLKKAVAFGTLAAVAGATPVAAADALGPIAGAASAGVFGVAGSLLAGASQTHIKPGVVNPYNYLHRARAQFTDDLAL